MPAWCIRYLLLDHSKEKTNRKLLFMMAMAMASWMEVQLQPVEANAWMEAEMVLLVHMVGGGAGVCPSAFFPMFTLYSKTSTGQAAELAGRESTKL